MNSNTSGTALELSRKKVNLITLGCVVLAISIAMYGLSLSTIQGPVLKSLGAESSFSLLTTIAALAMCIMTPVGGRLADIMGTKKVILYAGVGAIITGAILPILNNPILFMIDRFLLALTQGIMASIPYIIVAEINPRNTLPKIMGYLAAGFALGSLGGSYLAGLFVDLNLMWLAILFPVFCVIPAVWLICANMPNQKPAASERTLDWLGLLWLTIALSGISLSLNFGPSLGWSDWRIIVGFIVGIVALIILIFTEKKVEQPLIPLNIFQNKQYTMLLIVAFVSAFYSMAMTTYVPLGVQEIMHASNAASGMLQMPRTIVTILVPAAIGVWISKNQKRNTWIALAISGLCVVVCFAYLVFMGPHMALWSVIAMLAITGLGDSYRQVCITPAAQSLLAPKDMGIGTSMVGFFLTLSNLVSASIFGIIYDTMVNQGGPKAQIYALDTVFLVAAVTGLICVILSVTVYRKMSESNKYLYKPEETK